MITRMEVYSSRENAPELPISGELSHNDLIHIREITGLEPVKAEMATTGFATSKGVLYQGSSVGARNIVLKLGFNPDWADNTVATLRNKLYSYFMTQEWCKMRFYSSHLPPVEIEGYVESNAPNIFTQDPEQQISILCPKPDFIEPEATILTGVVDDGSTELEFDYIGTVETGFELRVQASVANPSYTGHIYVKNNRTVPSTFKIDPVTIDATKNFKLSTIQNAKRASNVDTGDAEVTNLLAYVTDDSEWALLKPGTNVISVAGEEDGQTWTLAYFNRFGGL